MKDGLKFADLFCGVGGFRLGMESAGFECVFSCDVNAECRRTYEANFGDEPDGDVRAVDPTKISDFDVLCAGFPCQPFSVSGKQMGFADPRGTLFFEILRFADAKKPKVLFLENVKNLTTHDNGRTFATIVGSLEARGYEVRSKVLNATEFGIPQNRERIVIVATRGKPFDFDSLRRTPAPPLFEFIDEDGTFERLDPSEYVLLENPTRQKSGLIFAGYRKKNMRRNGTRPDATNLSRNHRQPNRIYSVEGVHPTLTSQETSGRFFVLERGGTVRKLTLDECWRLMGFPDGFARPSPASEQYRQVGNSICVPMVREVAKRLADEASKSRGLAETSERKGEQS